MGKTCSTCGNTYTNIRSHQNKCKSLKTPGQNAAGQEEVSSSAWDGNDLLAFDVVRRPRSSRNSRDAMEDMDVVDALVLLQEPRGKDKSSDDESGVEHSGVEAADNPDVRMEFHAVMAVNNLMSFKPKRNSASVDIYGGTEKCANEALLVEETELTHNDDGQGLVDCPENSAVLMELKQPKLDLEVSDSSVNPASDDCQGGISDASGLGMPKGKQTSLTEPMAREVDQEPKRKLDGLDAPLPPKEQTAEVATSGADKSDEVLTSCSDKSSCSVECYGGGESTSDLKEAASAPPALKLSASSVYPCGGAEKSVNEAPAVEEKELSHKHSRQVLADSPEKSAATEVIKPKLDHKVSDNSVVMQEEKQKIDLNAPAPSDSSEEERSDIIDGQANQTP